MRLPLMLLLIFLIVPPVLAQDPVAPDDESRCSVCGMFVAPYPNWVAVLQLPDGKQFFFDGPKDMFIFFAQPQTYAPGVAIEQAKLFVTDYYTLQLLPAEEVFFVVDSDVSGPMGTEPVPVSGRDAAETFRRDHAGTGLMRFDGKNLVKVDPLP